MGFRSSFILVCGTSVALACSGSAFTQGQGGTGGADNGGGHGTGGVHGTGGSSAGGASGGNAGGVTGNGGVTGTGSRAGTGGMMGTGGTIGVGGSMGGACPPALPANGQPCSAEGLQCPYGQCCPAFAECRQGKWQVAIASCPQPVCPDSPPQDGDPCPCLQEGTSCDFNRCDSGGGHGESTCSSGSWKVTDLGCPRPNYCATSACPASALCMASVQASSGNVSLSCVLRQCPDPTAPVCSCIGVACLSMSGKCSPDSTGKSAVCDVP